MIIGVQARGEQIWRMRVSDILIGHKKRYFLKKL